MNKKKEENKKRKIIPIIFLYIGIFAISCSLSYLISYYKDLKDTENTYSEVRDLVDDDSSKDDSSIEPKVIKRKPDEVIESEPEPEIKVEHTKYNKVYEQNKDFVGWITVPGTIIDYPVMQTPGWEQKYLHTNFYGYWDYEGVPFCSLKSNLAAPSDNILIYGHHMKYGTMFAQLMNYSSKEFYDEHKIFYFDSIYRTGTYEVVAVILTDTYSSSFKYWNYGMCNKQEFNEYLDFIKSHALYKTDLIDSVEYGDLLCSLSTCAYHNSQGRMLVVGKMIDTDDKSLMQ